MKNIDIFTVLFASVIYLIMFIVWYSKFLFGKIYEELSNKEIKKSFFRYLYVFIFTFIISYVLALLEVLLGVSTFWDGVFLGFMVWLGFVVSHSVFSIINSKNNIKLFLIDNALYLLALLIMGGILAG